jgi:hypothetical protein
MYLHCFFKTSDHDFDYENPGKDELTRTLGELNENYHLSTHFGSLKYPGDRGSWGPGGQECTHCFFHSADSGFYEHLEKKEWKCALQEVKAKNIVWTSRAREGGGQGKRRESIRDKVQRNNPARRV